MTEPAASLAVVLPFPRRPAPLAEPAPADRLALAVAALRVALAEQEHALLEWRESLDDLAGALGGLHGSLTRYNTALDGLAIGVAALHSEAERQESLIP